MKFLSKFSEENLAPYAPTVLRIGIALAIIWFGSQQLLNTEKWLNFIPEWAVMISGLSKVALVHVNGSFELVFGTALLLGFYTRITSFLLALHMIHITVTVGYTPVGVRDFGLAVAAVSVFLNGVDRCTLDRIKK